ncbi:zinc finger CCHC domain-containing protein 8 [Trichonephila inaurata madagascariensis]|uniref:Zinc finger CCHC domain-containing protein 8 n=1 Tax=Trichonephila inaurata madagascariensis TaxID=2747483 RepID=A0A8X7CLV4_9ARAC|nr:zinc finger CCHC domain-containing protein 8 [Trichonephila inaurata madagascariensis]
MKIVERFKGKQTDADDDDDPSTSYPSLKELEEIKKQLVLELDSVSGNSSPIVEGGKPPNASDAEDSNPVSGSRDVSKDNNNDLSSFSDCSSNSNPTKVKQSSSSLHRSGSRSKRMTLGAPSLSRHSSFSKLPNYDKFSKNVASHMNFENLPNSTGTYERMRKVIKKVKDKIHSFIP